MVQDHSKANRELTEISTQHGIPVEQELDPEHRKARAFLAALRGSQFDAEYLLMQQQDHQRTAQLLEYEIGSGENATLQAFAVKTLPVVLRHLAMVQELIGIGAAKSPWAVRHYICQRFSERRYAPGVKSVPASAITRWVHNEAPALVAR
jgi:putative membrane protein